MTKLKEVKNIIIYTSLRKDERRKKRVKNVL